MIANQSSVAKLGINLLRDPQLNKSTAFTAAEREALGLTGLLPAAVDTEETQVQRALQQRGQSFSTLAVPMGEQTSDDRAVSRN